MVPSMQTRDKGFSNQINQHLWFERNQARSNQ